MTDPIDRALDRLEVITEGNFDHIIRPILTDLVAEIRAEEREKWLDALMHANADAERSSARLAAVEEEADRIIAHGMVHTQDRVLAGIFKALARGEGGEQARWGASESGGGCKSEEDPAGEPAAPDATQITMHAYEADTYGECKHCGYGPEHPRHGKGAEDRNGEG
jgi:hypothetical protein